MDGYQVGVSESLEAAYNAALEGCLIVEHEPPGVLIARGSSTIDLLHRMSTNDMTDLAPGQIRATVLTTAIGRTVDLIIVLPRSDDFLLLTSPGKSATVRDWLARYIFFNDDVRLEEVDAGHRLWGLYGPSADDEAASFTGVAPLALPDCAAMGEGYLWRTASPLAGCRLLAAATDHERALARWGQRGPGTPASEAYEAHRIEHGEPASGHELEDDVIPLEAGLWDLVSFTKGCYIGQEVIARMESRNRIARQLAGARLTAAVPAPQEVELEGAPVGRLTSSAVSPRLGPIGLALVRSTAMASLPADVRLSPSGIGATLVPLPLARPPG